MIIAYVGAGGKTTLIHRRAREYAAQGMRVLILTSTLMYREENTIACTDPEPILRALKPGEWVMAGSPRGEKIGPLPQECYQKVCAAADVVLIEADGSKHRPVKFPAAHEPVIYENVDEIVVVCGLHALGRRMDEAAHRPEEAARCLGAAMDTILQPGHIQTLVQKGYVNPLKEKYPDKPLRIHAAHDGSLYQRALAGLMEAGMDANLIRAEWFEPQPWLLICGGGHVSAELVRMAACLDMRIKVMDDRAEFANRERFPQADEVICDSFDHLERYLEPGACCVVVTRAHKDDFLCVQTLLRQPCRYVGMIGSRMKVEKTFDRLRGCGFSEAELAQLHAPIGLKIGAVTPAEIAVSILAEIIQEKNRSHIASASRELLNCRDAGTLCIIIEKTGSSPRGVGSMMFVGRDRVIGSIGGGAVEYAAIEDARSHSGAALRQYHLNDRDSARLGMICGGSNTVLFIPV